jgi:hypothetical protein
VISFSLVFAACCIIGSVGVMVRFSAGESEIEALLRFLARRTPGGMLMTPLVAQSRDDLRFRRTPRPLLSRLREDERAMAWGLRPAADEDAPFVASRNGSGTLSVDPEASRMIVLQLGPARGPDRRRDGLLEARDWADGGPNPTQEAGTQAPGAGPPLANRSAFARQLVERCARRIRRRGQFQNGRWHIP